MGLLGLACIFSTLVVIDGPLLQRSSTVATAPIVGKPVSLNVTMAPELPHGKMSFVRWDAPSNNLPPEPPEHILTSPFFQLQVTQALGVLLVMSAGLAAIGPSLSIRAILYRMDELRIISFRLLIRVSTYRSARFGGMMHH